MDHVHNVKPSDFSTLLNIKGKGIFSGSGTEIFQLHEKVQHMDSNMATVALILQETS